MGPRGQGSGALELVQQGGFSSWPDRGGGVKQLLKGRSTAGSSWPLTLETARSVLVFVCLANIPATNFSAPAPSSRCLGRRLEHLFLLLQQRRYLGLPAVSRLCRLRLAVASARASPRSSSSGSEHSCGWQMPVSLTASLRQGLLDSSLRSASVCGWMNLHIIWGT